MRRTLQLATMVMVLVAFSAASAKADETLIYTLTQQGTATPFVFTWEMPLNPTPACIISPCFESGNFFGFTTNVSTNGGAPASDILVFMNTGFSNLDLNDSSFIIPELTGQQLYSGDESTPTMLTGVFNLVDDGMSSPNGIGCSPNCNYTLDVAQTPEPSSLLLLTCSLPVMAAFVRRRFARRIE